MKVYADTNFFTSLYCQGPHNAAATQLHLTAINLGLEGYPVTMLGRLEFINALQQSVYFTRHGVPGIRLTPEMALVTEATFLQDFADAQRLCEVTLADTLIEERFQTLSHRHTAKEGFRTYDLLHVASALVLGCDTFWSFDAKAKKLAKLEGLATN